jgi:hypothetical protein
VWLVVLDAIPWQVLCPFTDLVPELPHSISIVYRGYIQILFRRIFWFVVHFR